MRKSKRSFVAWMMMVSVIVYFIISSATNVMAANTNIEISFTKVTNSEYSFSVKTSKINKIKSYEIYLNDKKISTIKTTKTSISFTIKELGIDDYALYVKVYYSSNKSITSEVIKFSTKEPEPTVTPATTTPATTTPATTAPATTTPATTAPATTTPATTVPATATPATATPATTTPATTTPATTAPVPTTAQPTTSPEVTTSPSPTSGIVTPGAEVYQDGIANAPELKEGMVPVKYDKYIKQWYVCSKADKEWYSYSEDKKMWANIMLLDSLSTAKHTNEQIRDLSEMYGTDLGEFLKGEQVVTMGSMYVWIPRFAYCIPSNFHSSNEKEIQIEFLKGTSTTSSVKGRNFVKTPGNGNWLIHPAFTKNTDNGGWYEEITGFWVAKFEASGSKENVGFVSGERSLTEISIDDMYVASKSISTTNKDLYGLKENTAVSHLMKNSEWGAVTYLTYSKYGRNLEEVSSNTNAIFTGGDCDKEAYKSNTNQSTTKNANGIYDLSGGSYEFVAAYTPYLYHDSDVSPNLLNAPYYMKNSYERGQNSETETYELKSNKYGDAMYETSNGCTETNAWFNDGSALYRQSFLLRGGSYFETEKYGRTDAGLFSFCDSMGMAFPCFTFRTCIVIR